MNWTEEEYAEYMEKRKAEALAKLNAYQPSEKTKTEPSVIECVIPIPPVTKKNHGQIVSVGKRCPTCKRGTKQIMLPSKQYNEYVSQIRPYLSELHAKIGTIDYPINLKCIFFTKTRRQSDLVGHLQAIQDLLTHYKCIADDCRDIVGSTDGSKVLYDKNDPRTEITITRLEGYEQWSTADPKPKRTKKKVNGEK